MLEINHNVVYVKGACNGALYNFNTRMVYSINNHACLIVEKLALQDSELTEVELNYKNTLIENGLYDPNFEVKPYIPLRNKENNLKMAWLEITQTCNLRCVHCYEGNCHVSATHTLTTQEWLNVIDQLKEEGVQRVVVIGGEPCCFKDVKTILEYLAQYNISTTLFSNGTLFNDSLIELMAQHNILAKFSLYGHTAEIHDSITLVKGSFDKLMATIQRLKQANVTVDIAVVAMRENQDYQEEIRDFITSLGITYRGYDVIRNVYGGTQNEHTPTNQDIINSSTFTKPSFVANKTRFDDNYYKNSCWHGKFAIIETGDVLPCVFERNLSYGNVRTQSIKEIMTGESLMQNWYKDFSNITQCKDCEYRFGCKDCRPLALSCKGDINDKNPRCLYNPYTGIWGGQE